MCVYHSQDEWEGMKKSLYFGLGCGIVGFGMLRYRRGGRGSMSGLSKYASSSSSATTKSTRSSGGYTFDPVPKPGMQQQHQQYQQQQQYQQYNNNAHHGGGSSGKGLVIDIALSTLVGLGTSIMALQTDIFYPTQLTISISSSDSEDEDNGNESSSITIGEVPPPPQWIDPVIPLVPGRSMIADTLCEPLTDEFRKFPKALWQSGNLNRGIENGYNNHMALYANSGWKGTKYYKENENASLEMLGEQEQDSTTEPAVGMYENLVLDSLQGFIINCERRARQERKLRKIRGLRENVAMVIPDGGVDADEDLELDDIYLIESKDDDDDDKWQ